MRLIDADNLKIPSEEMIAKMAIAHAPTINTKQIKYFDEDENVWKVGEVITDTPQTGVEFTYCPRCGMRILIDTPQTEKADHIPFDPLVEMEIKRMVEERLRQTERSE